MSSKVDRTVNFKNDVQNKDNNENSQLIEVLKKDYVILLEKTQQLLTDKLFLENECSRLKKRVNRMEEEISNLHAPPFVVGHLQDTINDCQADVTKFVEGNNSAGTRVRKAMQAVKALAQEVRVEVQDQKNSQF